MASLNKVILIGRLGRDPEVIDFENGNRKVTVTMATTERYRDRNNENSEWREQTEWHNIVVHGNLANDIAEKRRNYSKGDMMYIEGKLHTRQFVSKDGQNRRVTEVVADKMMLLTNPQRLQNRNTNAGTDNASPIDSIGDFADIDAATDIDPFDNIDNIGKSDLPF